jgi:hypothetical protein
MSGMRLKPEAAADAHLLCAAALTLLPEAFFLTMVSSAGLDCTTY